jgi:hypothetical protein
MLTNVPKFSDITSRLDIEGRLGRSARRGPTSSYPTSSAKKFER